MGCSPHNLYALQAQTTASTAKDAAGTTLDLTKRQLQSGKANFLAVLNAEQGDQQALINLIQARANRYADTAAFFRLLATDGGTAGI